MNDLVVGFTFDVNGSGDGFQNMDVTVIESPATPTLSASPTSLTGLNTYAGAASVSQSYDLTGFNLTPAAGNITVTAPANFEVSTDNTTFSNSVNVGYTGSSASATIYVRLTAAAPAGAQSGNVTNSGGGATDPDVAVDGNVCPNLATLAVGDVTILGFGTDNPDKFSFVNWVSLPAGQQLFITDNAWTESVLNSNEGTVSWTNSTGSAIAPGTVITFVLGTGFDLGTGSASGSFALSASQDNLFVYEGTAACPAFIFGITNNGSWLSSGSVNTNNSYLPSALNVANGNINTPSGADNWEYTSSRSDQTDIANYQAIVNNTANWTGDNSAITLSSTDFTVVSSNPSIESFLPRQTAAQSRQEHQLP